MKPEISHLEVHPAENGGVMVRHIMKPGRGKNGQDWYKEPEIHTFGADEHGEAMEHIAKHAGLESKGEKEDAEEERDEEKIEPGIHEKVAKMEKEEE